MTYNKPNMKYTDMCIYIDAHAYEEDRDDNLIFEYLYHISNMLAHKSNYFNKAKYYDDFAIYAAGKLFMRLINPKQFTINPDTGQPKLTKIKSILNYAKTKIYPLKVEFEQENYYQGGPSEADVKEFELQYTYKDKLVESVDNLTRCDFNLYLTDLPKITREFLKRIPYKCNTAIWNNIYLSCLLTLLSSITLSNKNEDKIANCKQINYAQSTLEVKLYETERDDVILFHLDSKLKPFIKVLVNELRHVFAKNLAATLDMYINSNTCLDNIKYLVDC